jgi:diacylglycerol O-acyltransferase
MDKKPLVLNRRLSGIDAAFLYLERKEIPLNIACVAVFDGPIPFREFVANIDSKLDLIPRYRQIPVPPPFNLGYPTWEYDPHFDIKRHIFRVNLDAPGGETQLEALAGRLLSQVLDRGKPLWEIHVVEGLERGRGALIVRIHHALADGVAGAALLKILLDPTPEGSYAIRRRRTRRPVPSWKMRSRPKKVCLAWPTGCSAITGRVLCGNSPSCCRNGRTPPNASPSTSRVRATASSAGPKSI